MPTASVLLQHAYFLYGCDLYIYIGTRVRAGEIRWPGRRGSVQVKLITYAPAASLGCQQKCEIWRVVKVHALIDGRSMSLIDWFSREGIGSRVWRGEDEWINRASTGLLNIVGIIILLLLFLESRPSHERQKNMRETCEICRKSHLNSNQNFLRCNYLLKCDLEKCFTVNFTSNVL